MDEKIYSSDDMSLIDQTGFPESEASKDVDDESGVLPIKPPLRILKYKTIEKKLGWWAAVVLLQSYARKQICF